MNDLGASVIARLKLRAAKDGFQLQLLLNLFCQEEFLRRISISKFNEKDMRFVGIHSARRYGNLRIKAINFKGELLFKSKSQLISKDLNIY